MLEGLNACFDHRGEVGYTFKTFHIESSISLVGGKRLEIHWTEVLQYISKRFHIYIKCFPRFLSMLTLLSRNDDDTKLRLQE